MLQSVWLAHRLRCGNCTSNGAGASDVRPMSQLYVITRQEPVKGAPSPRICHYSSGSLFIVCLTYILEGMRLSWIYTELILKNTEQSAFRISSIRNKPFMCQIRNDSVLYGTVGNPIFTIRFYLLRLVKKY